MSKPIGAIVAAGVLTALAAVGAAFLMPPGTDGHGNLRQATIEGIVTLGPRLNAWADAAVMDYTAREVESARRLSALLSGSTVSGKVDWDQRPSAENESTETPPPGAPQPRVGGSPATAGLGL